MLGRYFAVGCVAQPNKMRQLKLDHSAAALIALAARASSAAELGRFMPLLNRIFPFLRWRCQWRGGALLRRFSLDGIYGVFSFPSRLG